MTTPKILSLCKPLITLLLTIAFTPTASAEEPLGRLFFTPERRATLDRQRLLNIQDTQQINQDPTLTINGVVTRSSGKRTSWINGAPQNENDIASGTVIKPQQGNPGKIVVQSSDTPTANARVGETVNRSTGETRGLLNEGLIVVKPAASR